MRRSGRSNTRAGATAANTSASENRTRSALRGNKRAAKDETSSDEEMEVKKSSRNRGGAVQQTPISSRGRGKASQSQTKNNNDETLYEKDTYVAFVDPAEGLDKFKIAKLIEDLRDVDDEVEVNIYSETASLTFTRSAAKVPIFEYTIVCDVEVTEEPRGKKRGDKPIVKISRQQFNKVNRQMENAVRRIEDERKQKEEEDKEDEDEEESDEEEEEQSESPVKQSKASIAQRRMIKATSKDSAPAGGRSQTVSKKSATVMSSQPVNVKSVKGGVSASKAAPKRAVSAAKPRRGGKAKASLEESKGGASGSDEDMSLRKDEASEELEMIDTSKKRATKKREPSLPKVGQKRMRKSAKKNVDEDEDEEEEDQDMSMLMDGSAEDDEDHSQPVKKRKVGAGKAKAEKQPKAKKAPRRPTEFKKGKWNPAVELVKMDKQLEHPQSELFLDCCIRCNNRNVIRAAITGNERLLKEGIAAKLKISNLVAYWSPEIKTNSLTYILCKNQHNLLETMLHPKLHVPQHSTYDNERNIYFNDRIANPQYLMQFIDSGMVSHMAYGARVRKVEMTRGNRQGNNAFLQYEDNHNRNPLYQLSEENFLRNMLCNEAIEPDTFKQIYKLYPQIEAHLQSYVYEAVRAGNRRIAFEIVKDLVKYPNFGFNQLHADVLSEDAVLEKVLKVSCTKKANTNRDLTPLHCACINPNPKYLKALLDTGAEMQTIDTDLRRPVHYAAACQTSDTLKVLIDAGANLTDQDNQKRNCLHIAAITGRADNIRLILKTNPALVNTRDKKSMTPIVYAAKYGRVEAVKALLEFKAKVNAGSGAARMTPLCWAAAYGHYDLVEYLLNNKGRVLGKDKFQRTPLIMAVRNGHAKIASLLLQFGAEWYHTDSSMNTALHYAAAYGWLDCIDLLLKVGADVNANNSWKVSPINIAMLKNHHGCVRRFLEEPNVDVNGKDDKGRTLIILSLIILDEESYEFISYLLKKGADPNIADLEGRAALHYLAQYQPKNLDSNGKPSRIVYNRQVEIQKKVAQLLIQNRADLSLKDKLNRTAFSVCLDNDNAPLLEFLKDKVSINKDPGLFFAFENKIFNVEYQKILESLVQNDLPLPETINALDANGMTPFLAYIQSFTRNYDQLLVNISNKINQQSFIHGANKRMYKLTNADVFDKFSDQTNYYTYNANFTQEQKMEYAKEFFDSVIAKPFINILKFLISKGADPHAQVQKLKKYRDLEEQKRQQLLQLAEGEQNAVAIAAEVKKEEKVVRREEKLDEIKKRKAAGYGGFNAKRGKGYNPYAGQVAVNNNNPTHEDAYDKINGKKVLREYDSSGLRNAIHLIVTHPQKSVFDFLADTLEINPDHPDYDEVTPFNLASTQQLNNNDPSHKYLVDKFLKKEVRIDFPNRKGRTPFLNFYEKQNFELAYQMLDLGANVNQMDTSGLFALKYALIRRQNNSIQKLLDLGANINQIDNKGRNLLHHAINMSSATADATFETEAFLIERGVDINLRDNKNRTPMHYAFVKISDWKNSAQIDPIETVSSLCGCKGLELDVADKWKKTPLHYASQRGASICAMYLVQRGASLESKDIYGNTPLGVGLMYQHYNYGIILIQKGAKVNPTTFREEPDKIKKMWEEEEKAKKALYRIQKKGSKSHIDEADEEMMEDVAEDDESKQSPFAKHKAKKHQQLFAQSNRFAFGGANYYDEEDYDNEYDESDDEDDLHQENVFNQQNAFGMQVYGARAKKAQRFGMNQYGGFGAGFGGIQMAQSQPATTISGMGAGALIKESDKEGVSMFKLAIRGGQQGLAYLMLDNGYDLMLAMQDAMDEKKFMLVLTLLSKNPDDHVIQSKNSKGQNLFHILSMNSGSCSFEHLQRIYDALQKRGVDCKAKDNFGRTALHYSVTSGSVQLVKMLLESTHGYDPNEVDNEGHTPLSLFVKGTQNTPHPYYNPVMKHENIFYLLVKNGANVNVVYPEDTYKPALKEEELDEEHLGSYDPKGQYYCTPLIHLIRQNPQNETMRNNLIGLIEFGAKLDIVDSDGRDAVMLAIMKDNVMVIKMLLENKQSLCPNQNGQDKAGKSACHYVVNPVRFGSYENLEILKLLKQYGFSLQLKDAQGKTPAHYASEQESGVLLKELARLTGQEQQLAMISRQRSMIESTNWPEPNVDYEVDAEEYMELANEREAKLAKEKNQKVPVDQTGKFEVSYEVYYDDGERPWDVYLTKVDLKNGIYGDYVFYKMQLLYDTNRDLYVVFTRWGRIGENGMNQRTPFNKVDEAKEEFKKIFKQKTGGNNFEELDRFSRVKKKYNLTRVNYVTVNVKDYLQPFDYEKCPKSRLRQEIYELFEEISNVTMYQRAFNQFGIDTNVLPFSGISKQSLVEARQLLLDIQECIKEDIEISKEGIKADYDKLSAVKEKISELSSRYYELIPLASYKNQIAPPLKSQHEIKNQYDLLETLNNIEYASKVLLGALLRQKEMNPIDYVYQAMNLIIDPLDVESPEYEVIRTYIDNTRNAQLMAGGFGMAYSNQSDLWDIANIFKIQRKGEAEMIQTFKEVPNHYLLFHGSMMFNFIGILSQGLKIAPPEAPTTGYMFGKGVYFADMFDKSFAYSARGYQQQDSYLMLMCEVVLGKSKEVYQAEYIEKLEHPYQSVKGCGRRGPGYKHTITLPNGVKIPYGPVINYHEGNQDMQRQIQLQHNEYIVYNTSQIRMRYVVQIKKKDPTKAQKK